MMEKKHLKDDSKGGTPPQLVSPLSARRTPKHSGRRSLTCNPMSDGRMFEHLSRRHACDESFVEDVHLEFFYKPHSISALVLVIGACVYFAFSVEDVVDTRTRVWSGVSASCVVFLLVGFISLPSGPFIRPHPAFWRLVLAISILYWLVCTFILFQDYADLRVFIGFIFPDLKPLKTSGPLPWVPSLDPSLDGRLAPEDCFFTFDKVYRRVDRFVVAHFLGWFVKAAMLRSLVICLIASGLWELTELFFAQLLPNFYECWWDTVLLDLLFANFVGMLAGIAYCRYLEVKQYHWRSFKELPTRKLQIQRAVQQFTPASWTLVTWTPLRSVKRYLQVCVIIFLNQLIELNAFFLKAVLEIPATFPGQQVRLMLWCLICLPSLRQIYVYISDASCVRLGTQAWVGLGILLTETMIWVKFGFLRTGAPWDIKALLRILPYWGLTMMIFIFLCLYVAELVEKTPFRKLWKRE